MISCGLEGEAILSLILKALGEVHVLRVPVKRSEIITFEKRKIK